MADGVRPGGRSRLPGCSAHLCVTRTGPTSRLTLRRACGPWPFVCYAPEAPDAPPLSGPAVPPQEPPTIRVPVRLVTVPTLVFSADNRPIPDLRRSDFRLLDSGRPQPATLDTAEAPISVAVVIQVNQGVRQYIPFIARTGSVIDTLLAGESGEAAIVTYDDEVSVLKPFSTGDVASALRPLAARGRSARMIDAGVRALTLLAERPASRSRVLLFIGQPMDSGSESSIASLQQLAEKENVTVFALTLPLFGRAFVSDTFSLQNVSKLEGNGFRAGADLTSLIAILNRTVRTAADSDPFSTLTAATGGMQLRFRTQRQLEDALAAVGFHLRSAYLLSFYPPSGEPGYHTVKVEVNVPGAKVFARPGYWLAPN
jgi:VWFA-related protein